MIENLLFAVLFVVVILLVARKGKRMAGASPAAALPGAAERGKGDALFVSMFPELQPHFHPENLVAYVSARLARTPPRGGFTWKDAPGFGGTCVDIGFVNDREECSLVNEAGQRLAQFRFEDHAEGGVLRVGSGKLTVDLRNGRDPAVRYWHPEREFKWTRRGGWRFKTPVAEQPFDSGDRGTSWSDSTSSSSGSGRAMAAAAGVAGLGGTFDGGGASAGWDGDAANSALPDAESGTAASDDAGSESGSTSY